MAEKHIVPIELTECAACGRILASIDPDKVLRRRALRKHHSLVVYPCPHCAHVLHIHVIEVEK